MIKKELPYFKIENADGWNQYWFKDPGMYIGGCAAVTACDSSVFLALHKEKVHLYPYDPKNINKKDYIAFSKKMKPFLKPRLKGIDTLDIYIEGINKYFKQVQEAHLEGSGFSAELPLQEAEAAIRMQIDEGFPIPFLLLKHKSPRLKNFTWHWFLIVGYEQKAEGLQVKIATYGRFHWLSFKELWDTGYEKKGGMIILKQKEEGM